MPYEMKWTDPDVFLEHKGITVYHIYEEDEVGRGYRDYWFTVSPCCGEEESNCEDGDGCPHVFDVRNLTTWVEPIFSKGDRSNWYQIREQAIKAALMVAIDGGILTENGYNGKERE